MMFRFFLPDFEFELDEWQQHLNAGEATLAEGLCRKKSEVRYA